MAEFSTKHFATKKIAEVFAEIDSSQLGLSSTEAENRLSRFGPNAIEQRSLTWWRVFQRQLKNPILVLLTITVLISMFVGELANSIVILVILLLSIGLGFISEFRAEKAAEALHSRIAHKASCLRDGNYKWIKVSELVVGDVVQLSPGSVVPADLRIISSDFLECDESLITGESLPVSKQQEGDGDLPSDNSNTLLMGTIVHSGSATAIVVATGSATEFGQIEAELNTRASETEFQIGLRKFSSFLLVTAMILTGFIFFTSLLLGRDLLDSLLFSLAIAIGMTPQLLPAVVSIGLAKGSKKLIQKNILVKRLISIEDMGDINVLVTDKTGTLTDGRVALKQVIDSSGNTKLHGALASDVDYIHALSSQVTLSAIDSALWRELGPVSRAIPGYTKLLALPFDSRRRRTSCVVEAPDKSRLLVTKGAAEEVLALTNQSEKLSELNHYFEQGFRVLAVASKKLSLDFDPAQVTESELELDGFLLFSDPIKSTASKSLGMLKTLGIEIKIATGDSALVARKVCEEVGIENISLVNGFELEDLSEEEFVRKCQQGNVFARVTPEQKAHIVKALRKDETTVGFMGDGVNDAIALHAADVGISVDSATDVAKDAADIVLLEKDLGVLADAIYEGRRVFSNTMKYVLMSTSGDFGNMFSAAIGSVFLKFMPMLPSQVLLNDLMYDSSQLALPSDRVDEAVLRRPSQWNVRDIKRFMLTFGPASSIFDFATFALMLFVFQAGESEFQTGWFVESLATEILIIFVIRTRLSPFYRSRPSKSLVLTVLGILALGCYLPYSPFAPALGFVPLPAPFFLALALMVLLYLLLVESLKHRFYKTIPLRTSTTKKNQVGRLLRRVAGFRSHR